MFRRRDAAALSEPRRAEVSAEIQIRAPLRAVWDLLVAPGSGGLALGRDETAHVAPGTGPGVGEVHVVVARKPGVQLATVRALLVTAFEPAARFSRVAILGTTELRTGSDYELARAGGEVWLTSTSWFEVASGVNAEEAERTLASLRRAVARADMVVLQRIQAALYGSAHR